MRRLVMTYLASDVTGCWRFDRHLASSICQGRTPCFPSSSCALQALAQAQLPDPGFWIVSGSQNAVRAMAVCFSLFLGLDFQLADYSVFADDLGCLSLDRSLFM